MNTTEKTHHSDNPPAPPAVENNEDPRDRPVNPNPVEDGTRFQGVEYPEKTERAPDGESAIGREEAEAAGRDQEKIGTPDASP